jgi:hypothetical protein
MFRFISFNLSHEANTKLALTNRISREKEEDMNFKKQKVQHKRKAKGSLRKL